MKKLPKNYRNLLQQLLYFMADSGVSVTAMCERCELSRAMFYAWRRGDRRISGKMAQSINEYLSLFGYQIGGYLN